MGLELSYAAEQLALQESIDTFCRRSGLGARYTEQDPLPAGFWEGLAEIGVLGLGTELGGGGATEIAAAMECLGGHGAPGPLVGTFAAGVLLDDDALEPVLSGTTLVSVGDGALFPWAPRAGLLIELNERGAWLVQPHSMEQVETTAGEPWARVEASRVQRLEPARLAAARAEVAGAAYLVGAGQRLLRDTADYARDRTQFGKPIATFQAVSHPLADASVRLAASQVLCRGAAQRLDESADERAWTAAATARLSAVGSATAMAYLAHQLHGAFGFTKEGPVAHLSHRIRQVGMLPPSPTHSREMVLAGVLDRRSRPAAPDESMPSPVSSPDQPAPVSATPTTGEVPR